MDGDANRPCGLTAGTPAPELKRQPPQLKSMPQLAARVLPGPHATATRSTHVRYRKPRLNNPRPGLPHIGPPIALLASLSPAGYRRTPLETANSPARRNRSSSSRNSAVLPSTAIQTVGCCKSIPTRLSSSWSDAEPVPYEEPSAGGQCFGRSSRNASNALLFICMGSDPQEVAY